MLIRKSKNTPLLRFMFAFTSTLKRVFSALFKEQLRSSKGVFVFVNQRPSLFSWKNRLKY